MWNGFPKSGRPAMLKEGNRHGPTVLIIVACASASESSEDHCYIEATSSCVKNFLVDGQAET